MRAGMILPFSLMKSFSSSTSLKSISLIFSAVAGQNLRRLNSGRKLRSSFFLSFGLPLPRNAMMSCSSIDHEFVHVQDDAPAAAAAVGQESAGREPLSGLHCVQFQRQLTDRHKLDLYRRL